MGRILIPRLDQVKAWEAATDKLNALDLGLAFVPPNRSAYQVDSPMTASRFGEVAYSTDDVASLIAENILDAYRSVGSMELLESARDELIHAYDDAGYDFELPDCFQTFFVFYLNSPNGHQARSAVPSFYLAFEIWMTLVDEKHLERLHKARLICLEYNSSV